MAETTREPATTLAPSLSIPAAPTVGSQKAPLASPTATSPTKQTGPQPQLSSIATAGLTSAVAPLAGKRQRSPALEPPQLTGAAAMEDNERHRREQEEQKQQSDPQVTPNPAIKARTALMGGGPSAPVSKPARAASPSAAMPAPSSTALPMPSEPISIVPNANQVSEPMEIDQTQTSPISMSGSDAQISLGSRGETSTNVASSAEHSNKALTYPPRIPPSEQHSPAPPRGLSYPVPGTGDTPRKQSTSSNKKHKCPHCSTEFTRHHNLKSHLLTHSQEKPYACSTCSSRFRRLHDLKRHLKLHTGERPHTCQFCGRKFARGDALARHMKGANGCAGRRGSVGDGGEYPEGASELDQSMDGVQYEGEPSVSGDERVGPQKRRKSEPDRKASTAVMTSSSGPYRHSSTYPAPSQMQGSSHSLAPPHATSQRRQDTSRLSPRSAATGSYSTYQFNASPDVFPQGGMTESPKPLSPGQVETHRHEPSFPQLRGRSPSLTSQLQQQHLPRSSTGRATPPVNLPPPQLPGIAGLAPDHRSPYPSQQLGGAPPAPMGGHSQPPSISAQQPPPPPLPAAGSNPGSATSHAQSSGNSMRDILGPTTSSQSNHNASNITTETNFGEYIQRMREDFHAHLTEQKQMYESSIRSLQSEIEHLRSQQNQASHHQPLPPPTTTSAPSASAAPPTSN